MTGSPVLDGSLLLAIPVAAAAGLVSFLSPCVLPLVPGYLSYVTGLAGTDLAEQRRGRMLAGSALFVLGFAAVFVSYGVLFGGVSELLQAHRRGITIVLGALTIVLGLAFMGAVPGLANREFRMLHRRPAAGLLGAPMLGVLFGLGWAPCIGPTLGAVQTLAYSSGTAARGALLSAVYCLGLGVPFLVAALAYRRVLGGLGWVRRHYRWVTAAGGAMLVVIGVLLVTGVWDSLTIGLRTWASGWSTPL
ncbi:MAG: cytochrome c biogenesis CcdA family protein [Actinomycetales bacterium]